MKRPNLKFLTLLLLLASANVFCQDEKSGNWKFGFNLSPEIGYRYLTRDKDAGNFAQSIIEYRNETENPSLMLTTGFSAERSFGKRFTLRSGIHYSLRGEKLDANGLLLHANGDMSTVHVENWYHSHFIGIPFNALYSFLEKEKIRFFGSLGMDLNFLYLNSQYRIIEGHDKEFFSQTVKESEDLFTYHIFNPSAYAALGIDLSLGKKSTLRIEPNFRYSVRPLVDAPINGYYYNYGLNIGYLLAF